MKALRGQSVRGVVWGWSALGRRGGLWCGVRTRRLLTTDKSPLSQEVKNTSKDAETAAAGDEASLTKPDKTPSNVKSPYKTHKISSDSPKLSPPQYTATNSSFDLNSPTENDSYSTYVRTFHSGIPTSSTHPTGKSTTPDTSEHTSRVWGYTASVNNSLKDIEQSLMNRIHESNKRRFRLIFFGTLGAIIWFFIAFGETIGTKLKSMTTGLALETLEDKAIKIQTEELARAVVQTVLNDKEVTAQAASFLREASHAPETQEALLKLTLHVLKHPDSLNELSLLTKNVLASLSSDPEAIKHLAVLFCEVFQDPELKQQLNTVASEICLAPEVMAAATELTSQVFREPVVQEAVNDILTEGSSNVMKNEEISVQSRQFVAEVMGDDSLQREGGNALWNSIYHALVPGAIRITGFSLICLSLGLGGLMLSPY